MRIPLSWLKDYISISLTPSEIAKLLTMAGLEVDGWETIGEHLNDVVVGRILEAGKHPNADKLILASVTDGKETFQIVCGAQNCRAGVKTALARIGAKVYQDDQIVTIKKAKIRGIESSGMLCSGTDIKVSEKDDGILELPDNWPDGSSLSEFFSDTYFDISLTPNLSHCMSVIGVARELSALTEQPLLLPQVFLQEADERIEECLHVHVEDKVDCPRYACRLIKNVQVSPSPDWLKQRLEKSGLRSVNNIVDATNYILLETGHPLHAFDYDKLEGGEIIVRKAREGERLKTLDGKEQLLKEAMLLICDRKKPAAIAGVMGGMDSEISGQTRNVVLESAYFDSKSIRRTSKQLGLQTDASKRFERGTDPNQVVRALNRAAALIQQLAGGEIQAGLLDVMSKEFPEAVVSCRLSRISQIIGVMFSRGEVENVFKRLQFPFQWDGKDQFTVLVPTYRVDIKAEIDLIEEVARLYGYDNIPRKGGRYKASNLPSDPISLFEKEIRTRMIREGLQEFLTCDLIGPTLLEIVQDHSTSHNSQIKILNPTSVEQSILRTSLLPGLLQVVKYNIDHQNHRIEGFEVGRIHFRDGNGYKEQSVAGIILTGNKHPPHWSKKPHEYDFFDLKGILENLLENLRISTPIFKNLGLETFHSGRQASIFVNSLEIGSFGEIHPGIQRRLDVPQRILFAEFNLHDLLELSKPLEKVKPLSIYPCSERDWTFTVKESVSFAQILDLIRNQRSAILEEVSVKDIYRSEKLSPGFQNITLHFIYRDLTKTIEQEVVEAEHSRLTTTVLQQLGDAVKLN